MMIDFVSSLNEAQKSELRDYVERNSGVNIGNGQFEVSSETELKNLLYAFEQRFYETIIGGERRVANSYRRL